LLEVFYLKQMQKLLDILFYGGLFGAPKWALGLLGFGLSLGMLGHPVEGAILGMGYALLSSFYCLYKES
jgi:hypothetical protein